MNNKYKINMLKIVPKLQDEFSLFKIIYFTARQFYI